MNFHLADLFESIADAVPERTALVCGEQRRTFAQLDRRANQCAHALAARGVKAGDVVGLYLMNGAEYLEAMIGCFKMRAVPVNVNFRYVEDELHYLLDDAGAVAVIHQQSLAPRLATVRDFAERSPDDLYVIYTGGTTGMPKGVMWRQEDIFFSGMLGGNPAGPAPTRPEEVAERVAAGTPNAGIMSGDVVAFLALGTLLELQGCPQGKKGNNVP